MRRAKRPDACRRSGAHLSLRHMRAQGSPVRLTASHGLRFVAHGPHPARFACIAGGLAVAISLERCTSFTMRSPFVRLNRRSQSPATERRGTPGSPPDCPTPPRGCRTWSPPPLALALSCWVPPSCGSSAESPSVRSPVASRPGLPSDAKPARRSNSHACNWIPSTHKRLSSKHSGDASAPAPSALY